MRYDYDLSLVDDMTVSEIQRKHSQVMMRGVSGSGVSQDVAVAAHAMWLSIRNLRFTDRMSPDMTMRRIRELASLARVNFIVIHRVNYMAFYAMTELYDWMDEKRKVTYNVRRFWRKVERTFTDYQRAHREMIDRSPWMTIQDHMRIANDALAERKEALIPVIRDYMIQHREPLMDARQVDDIELLARTQAVLFWTLVTRHSYDSYFRDYACETGIDFSSDFKYADMRGMTRNFVWMMEQAGVRFDQNGLGDYMMRGFDGMSSNRIEWAWNDVISIVRDNERMDQSALQAINLNPETKAEYEKEIAREEEEAFEEAAGRLGSKFNLKRK